MCGIFFCIFNDEECCQKSQGEALIDSVVPLIKRRGPDRLSCKEKIINDHKTGKQYKVKLIGSVLHLRGSLTTQPLEDTNGNLMLWNGEVFGGVKVPDEANDTSVILNLLDECSDGNSASHILNTMSDIQGPWSFIYYQAREGKLWFGRDYFGRRSLVWHLPTDEADVFAVSSVATRTCQENGNNWVWEEVPADGIYCLESSPERTSHTVQSLRFYSFRLKKYIWSSLNEEQDCYQLVPPVLQFNKQLPSQSDLQELDEYYDNAGLTLGCSLLSLNDVNCSSSRTSESEFKGALGRGEVSSAINNQHCIVRGGTGHNVESLHKLCSRVITSTKKQVELAAVLIEILGEAVRKRVFNLPRKLDEQNIDDERFGEKCALTDPGYNSCARIGVLFSGGLDSIVLAVLADRFVPENEAIDLINVAFEQKQPMPNPTDKKTKRSNAGQSPPNFDVPDRITGRSGLSELAIIHPSRKWNFIEVNVVLQDLQNARCEHITHLVSPLNSVLDDSIGCALWFAARGSGTLRCPSCINEDEVRLCVHPEEYTSKAKVLLVGMGADEQLGGYARHRTKFNQQGWLGLVHEMEMEVNRISERNLGRDDRCISDHGREARFPFLDEQVVSFLSSLPVWLKADPRLPRGTGEKILLRKSAKLLGLTSSAVLPKRAIQFGSRIAKLESNKEKGSDKCTRLKP